MALVGALLAGCGGTPEADTTAAGGVRPTAADEAVRAERERIDALRALPYVGVSPRAPAPEGRDGVVALDAARAAPGYRLLTLRGLCRAELLDLDGRVVRAWARKSHCRHWSHSELTPAGELLVVGHANGHSVLMRFDWNGALLGSRARLLSHHDVDTTPAGGVLTITKRRREGFPLDGGLEPIFDDRITLLRDLDAAPTSLSLTDLLAANGLIVPTGVREHGHIDLIHANSVEWQPHERLIGRSPLYCRSCVLVSMRHQDLVAIVDWRRRRLLWWWGRGELEGPHDATLLADGHVLVFDNGLARGASRVVEVDPASGRIVWQYRASPPESLFTHSLGGAQRLPNGNTLFTESLAGEAVEVTRAGEVVWRYRTPHRDAEGRRAAIVRAKLYDAAAIDRRLARRGAPPSRGRGRRRLRTGCRGTA